ncbi:P-loop NTPase fold protein [Crocinitomix catalasitica]|uniref:P-loop NTPase fold protein n=1 Tax=Crocinitomix catalasitica TaxID=184607 RepID=UPI00048465FB|nr:P-loop NTPase fold protein [Crocinitomix catalasitica]
MSFEQRVIELEKPEELHKVEIGEGFETVRVTAVNIHSDELDPKRISIIIKYFLSYKNGEIRNGPVIIIKEAINGIQKLTEDLNLKIKDVNALHFSYDTLITVPKGADKTNEQPKVSITYNLLTEDEESKNIEYDDTVQYDSEERYDSDIVAKINQDVLIEGDEMSNRTVVMPLSELNTIADQIHAEGRMVYAVGSTWGSEDQTARFLENNIWENGDDTKRGNIVNQVEIDDVLIIKSTFQRNGVGIFRVKALGRVLKNYNNGSKLDVDWFYRVNNLDFEGELSKFRYRISSLNLDKYSEIFNGLDQIKLGEIFNQSVKKSPPSNIGKLTITNEEEVDKSEIINNQIKLSSYRADDSNGADLLGINNDIRSFATLIAHKEINPPIAIALLGEWGSGKSFFMNKLEASINSFPKENDTVARDSQVKGIAHIKFNAWSYMDSNLWAGFADSLFEKLNEYINNHTKGDLARLKVKVKIHNNIKLLNSKITGFETRSKDFKNLKQDLVKEKKHKILRYFRNEYNEDVQGFLKINGWTEDKIKTKTPQELKRAVNSGINISNYIRSNSYQITAIILSLIVAGIVFQGVFTGLINTFNWKIFNWVKSIYTSIIIALSPILFFILKYWKKGIKATKKLDELIQSLKKPDSVEKIDEKLKALNKELKEIDELIAEVNKTIRKNVIDIEQANEIAISNLIENVNENEDYSKHLGIISTIRKDFETLSSLFLRTNVNVATMTMQSSNEENTIEKDRKEIENIFEKEKQSKLERIVLYIDDLDRCSDEKVVEVLEAVNLLMAFPLFVVVVGVDPRWVNNALLKKHALHFNGNTENEQYKTRLQKIGVSDYLEKIFQIPFQLKKPTNEDAKNMIDHIFKDEIEDKPNVYSNKIAEMTLNTSEEDAMRAEYDAEIQDQKREVEAGYQDDYQELERGKNKSEEFQKLKLSKEEFNYLKEMIWLIDNSPRSIKRFTNIYRIVRSHENLTYSKASKNRDFLMVMFVLGLNLGSYKESASELFETLSNYPEKSLGKILQSSENELLKMVFDKVKSVKLIDELLDFKGGEFLKHIPFIKRFSFDNQI